MKLLHSNPLWTGGPRQAHAKFGGGVFINGQEYVETRASATCDEFPGDYTSGHLLHEIQTEIRGYSGLNSRFAIGWQKLIAGIEEERYPHIAALTVPAFGWPGAEHGAILSPDENIRQMVRDLHLEAIEKAGILKERGLGMGTIIWWPGFDSHRRYRLPTAFPYEEGWKRLVEFWCGVLQETGGVIHVEWKPSVPGDHDYINSIGRAIRFCNEVNKTLGRLAMVINNEWAHLLIGGSTVLYGTEQTIEADLFSGFFHANSADLAEMGVNDDTGEVTYGSPADDADWYVGAGGQERWNDQVEAVKTLGNWAEKTGKVLVAEHDIDPGGEDPIEYYRQSRENLVEMFASAGFEVEEEAAA